MSREKRNISKFNVIGFSAITLICMVLGIWVIVRWINESLIFTIMGFFVLGLGILAVSRIFIQPKYHYDPQKTKRKPKTTTKDTESRPIIKTADAIDGDYSDTERARQIQRY